MRLASLSVLAAVLAFASSAWADKVAVAPSHGGDSADHDRELDRQLAAALASLGHTLTPPEDVAKAQAALPSATLTPDALQALGASLGVEWVVTATESEAVTSVRVELGAALVGGSRFESVAREVDRGKEQVELAEMAQVLLRKEGVGTGALPWENTKPLPGATGEGTTTVVPPKADAEPSGPTHMQFLASEADVDSTYDADRHFFFGLGIGFDVLAARPSTARGTPAALTGTFRIGGSIPTTGLELFAELGGHLVNTPSVIFGGGARYMFTPVPTFAFHLGPSARVDGYAVLGTSVDQGSTSLETSTEIAPSVVGSVEMALGVTPLVQLDAHVGEVRWIGLSSGDVLSVGMDLGASLRF